MTLESLSLLIFATQRRSFASVTNSFHVPPQARRRLASPIIHRKYLEKGEDFVSTRIFQKKIESNMTDEHISRTCLDLVRLVFSLLPLGSSDSVSTTADKITTSYYFSHKLSRELISRLICS